MDKQKKRELSQLSVRIPNDLIRFFDELAEKTGKTRNDIIIECLEFSVDNLNVEEGK